MIFQGHKCAINPLVRLFSLYSCLYNSSGTRGPFLNYVYFFYIWLHWVFVAACRHSLLVASRGSSLLVVHRLLTEAVYLVSVLAFITIETVTITTLSKYLSNT